MLKPLLTLWDRLDMHDKNWAWTNYLSLRALQQADNVRAQLQRTMERFEVELVSLADQTKLFVNVRKALVCGFFMQVAHKEGEKGNYLIVKDHQVIFFFDAVLSWQSGFSFRLWLFIHLVGWIINQNGLFSTSLCWPHVRIFERCLKYRLDGMYLVDRKRVRIKTDGLVLCFGFEFEGSLNLRPIILIWLVSRRERWSELWSVRLRRNAMRSCSKERRKHQRMVQCLMVLITKARRKHRRMGQNRPTSSRRGLNSEEKNVSPILPPRTVSATVLRCYTIWFI